MEDRVVAVEESTKSAHKRLDTLENRVIGNEGVYMPIANTAKEMIPQILVKLDEAEKIRQEQAIGLNTMVTTITDHMVNEEKFQKLQLWGLGIIGSLALSALTTFYFELQTTRDTQIKNSQILVNVVKNQDTTTSTIKEIMELQNRTSRELFEFAYEIKKEQK